MALRPQPLWQAARMKYGFRIKFQVGRTNHILCERAFLALADLSADGESVTMRSVVANEPMQDEGGLPIQDAAVLEVRGLPYKTQDEAQVAGRRWMSWLRFTFARQDLGVDFGGRGPSGQAGMSRFTPHLQTEIPEAHDDIHGLGVYRLGPAPLFVALQLQGKFGRWPNDVLQGVKMCREHAVHSDSLADLAYDVYGLSFFVPTADARFLMLMTALECLIERQSRSVEVRAHVEVMLKETKDADLPEPERQRLVSALGGLKLESITAAGARLADSVERQEYLGTANAAFFKRAYDMRSRLVHGADGTSTWRDIDAEADLLQRFVARLIAERIIRNTNTR